jgi:hypothetical protein
MTDETGCMDQGSGAPVRLPVEPVGPLTTPTPASSTATPLPTRWHVCPWLTPSVLSLARAAYEDRSFDPVRLAILADALEEAGCDKEALLDHLRSPHVTVRGCWALELILGKE